MSRLPKLGILGSGSGSNCQSIYDAIQSGSLRAEIAVVMSDNPDAYILERARSWGIPAEVIDCGGFKTRFPEESQASVAARLKQYGVDCVCLAGFMPGETSAAEGISFPHSEYPPFPSSSLPGASCLGAGCERRSCGERLHRPLCG